MPMTPMMADLKELHDTLLAEMPDGADHSKETCPLCTGTRQSDGSSTAPGGEMSRTYTQEEFDSAVADAIAPLEEKIKELATEHEQSEVEARFAKEKAELEEQITDLQSKLDSAVLEASEAKKTYDELVAHLESHKADQEAAAELARRRDERLAKVREIASFPEEYVENNADRWARLSDEDFEALVADWQEIAAKREGEGDHTETPTTTAMTASRNGDGDHGNSMSAVREIFGLKLAGSDPRTL